MVKEPPTFTSADTTTFTVGTAGTFDVTAGDPALTDNAFDITLSETGALPAGVTFTNQASTDTASLDGTPAAGSGGTYDFTITASNGTSPDTTQAFTLVVKEPPTFTSADTTTFTVGTAGTFDVTAGDPALTDNAFDITLSETGALPAGVTFTNQASTDTASLDGTPAAGSGGTYDFTITASNGTSPDTTQAFTLVVKEPPTFTSADTTTFTVGTAGTFDVTAGDPALTDNAFDITLSETGALPAGVTFTNQASTDTASLDGTPAAGSGGTYDFTITASNGTSPDTTQAFTLVVKEPPTFTSADTTTFTVGTAGTFDVTAGDPALTDNAFDITLSETGALPAGVTFTNQASTDTASLDGTPAAGSGGTYDFTITASNGTSPDTTQAFTLVVKEPPTFTSADTTTFTVGTAGTFDVTAGDPALTDNAFDITLSETGALPAGVTFTNQASTDTASLDGTPAAGSGGTYDFTITASNGTSPDTTQAFTLVVKEPPTFTSADTTTFTVGTAGTFDVTAGDPALTDNAFDITLSETGALPAGVTFTNQASTDTASLDGTPAAGSGGTYDFTITASNGTSPDTTQAFTLVVKEPPTFTSADTTAFGVGTAGTFTVNATDANTTSSDITLSETGALPNGVTFVDNGNDSATLAGTPAAGSGGSYPLTITATNGSVPDATQTFTLTVASPPTFTSTNPTTTFNVGTTEGYNFTATDANTTSSDISFSETGALPAGVTFVDNGNDTATLGGIPAAGSAGSYPLTITASNGTSPDTTQAFTLVVKEPPTFTSADTTAFGVGTAGTFTVNATDANTTSSDITLFETGALPNGVTFVDNGNDSATLAGTPAAGSGGSYPLTITATNGSVPDATQTFTLTVASPPTFTSTNPTTTFNVGTTEGYNFTATDANTTSSDISFSETGALPAGVTFVDNGNDTATLGGIPAAGSAGSYPLTITASNGTSPDTTQAFTLVVKDVPGPPEAVVASASVGGATVSWTAPSSDGGSAITGYTVTATPGGQVSGVNGITTTTSFSGLNDGTAYSFTVEALNAQGPGPGATSNVVVPTSTPIVNPATGTSTSPGGTATTPTVTSGSGSTLSASATGEGTVNVGLYSTDPVAQLGTATDYFDVSVAPGSSFSAVTFQICGVAAATSIEWWNPVSASWQTLSGQTLPQGTPPCITATVTNSSVPSISQLYGTIFAVVRSPRRRPSFPPHRLSRRWDTASPSWCRRTDTRSRPSANRVRWPRD